MDGMSSGDAVNVARQIQNTLAGLQQSLDLLTAALQAQTALLATVLPGVQSTAASATAGSATLPSAPATFINTTVPGFGPGKVPVYNP